VRKEYQEINRLRRSYERQINFRLISTFSKIGSKASDAFLNNGTQGYQAISASIRNDVATTLELFYRQVILAFAKRTFTNRYSQKAIQDYEGIYKQFMQNIGGTRITEISDTTRKIISKTILDNQTAGVSEIAKAINEKMSPRFTKARASTIARTETHTASSFAIQKQAENFEAPNMRKRWVATTDDRSRGTHLAVNGTEVGIDEDFIVGGKKMKYAGDPRGGASEVINCRCVIVYIEPEDVIVDQDTPIQTTPKPQVNISTTSMLDSVIDKSLTSATIKILPLEKATSILSKYVKDASNDNRYINKDYGIYRKTAGDKGTGFGIFDNKSKQMDKKSLSMLVALLPELDNLAKKFNVTNIRGLTTAPPNSSFWAEMGDGILIMNTKYVNSKSLNIGSGKPKIMPLSVKKEINDLKEKINLSTQPIDQIYKKYNVMTINEFSKKANKIRSDEIINDYNSIVPLYNERNKWQDEILNLNNSYSIRTKPISKWKRSDKLKNRPHNTDEFWESPLDQFRSTLYHEFGHHVHQTYKYKVKDGIKRKPYYQDIKRPLEVRLKKRDITHTYKKNSPTDYGATDTKEWFVENFSLYFMERKDLVDPKFIEVLEEMMNDKIF